MPPAKTFEKFTFQIVDIHAALYLNEAGLNLLLVYLALMEELSIVVFAGSRRA